METEQFIQLIDMISKVSEKQDALHGDFREFKGSVKVEIDQLQEADKNDRLWVNIKTFAVIPIVAVLHQIATHFGWIK